MSQTAATDPRPIQLRGAAAAFYQCTDPEVLVEGRAGTGKSIGTLTRIHHDALVYPHSRQLIVRQTRVSCDQSVLVTWEEKVLGPLHPMVANGAERANRTEYRFPNGSVVAVGGLDNPEKLFSTEWDRVYLNEGIEAALDAWELFGRAMRNNRMPFQQRVADVNPGPPSHWINKRATPATDDLRDADTRERYRRLQRYNHGPQSGTMRRLISVHQDNPAYFDIEKWEWTLLGQHYINTLSSMTGHRRERMLRGRWIAAEGSVFPEFDEARHVFDTLPAGVDTWPHYLGYDPGYDHPTAILWVAVAPNGTYYVVDEVYQGGRSVEEHAAEVRKRNAQHPGRTVHGYYGDPQHAFSQTAQSVVPIATQFKKAMGVPMTPWPRSKDVESMVNAVRRRLAGDEHGPKLKVWRGCPNTIAEFQTWRYKRTSKGELPPGDDQFEDANNHAIDVVKGLVAMNLRYDRMGVRVIDAR